MIKTGQHGGDYIEYTVFISDTQFVRALISASSLIISKTAPQTYRLRKQFDTRAQRRPTFDMNDIDVTAFGWKNDNEKIK